MKTISGAVVAIVLIAGLILPGVSKGASAFAGTSEARTTLRPDGSEIHWQIDRRGKSGKQSVVVLAQGSGCLPTGKNENLIRFRALAPGHAVLTVEKYGVSPADKASAASGECPAAYARGHTVSQRADDYERVLGELKREAWWDGRVALFGGSEGGAAVAVLAPRLEKLDAVIIMSTGTGIPMADWIKDALPPPVAAQADGIFARIRENPQSIEMWGGNSWKWWADIMDRDLAQDLMKVRSPILIIHGERDQFAPVRAARATRDRFAAAGLTNLTYREREGLDHFMVDSAGTSLLGQVLDEARAWLEARRPQ